MLIGKINYLKKKLLKEKRTNSNNKELNTQKTLDTTNLE